MTPSSNNIKEVVSAKLAPWGWTPAKLQKLFSEKGANEIRALMEKPWHAPSQPEPTADSSKPAPSAEFTRKEIEALAMSIANAAKTTIDASVRELEPLSTAEYGQQWTGRPNAAAASRLDHELDQLSFAAHLVAYAELVSVAASTEWKKDAAIDSLFKTVKGRPSAIDVAAKALGIAAPTKAAIAAVPLSKILCGEEIGLGGSRTRARRYRANQLPTSEIGDVEKKSVLLNWAAQNSWAAFVDAVWPHVARRLTPFNTVRSLAHRDKALLHPQLPYRLMQRHCPGWEKAHETLSEIMARRLASANETPRDQLLEEVREFASTSTSNALKRLREMVSLGHLGDRLSWPRNRVITTMGHVFKLDDFTKSFFITGAPGSGKSSAVMRHIAKALLAGDAGGLFLCNKSDAAEDYIKWATESGRGADVVHITEDNIETWAFNVFQWEFEETRDPQQLLRYYMEMCRITGQQPEQAGQNNWVIDGMKRILRIMYNLLMLAGEELSFENLQRLLTSMPGVSERELDQSEIVSFNGSYAGQVFALAKANVEGDPRKERVLRQVIEPFLFRGWSSFSVRERTTYLNQIQVLVEQVLSDQTMAIGMGGATAITPECFLNGKIVVLDMPLDMKEDSHLYAAALWKLALQWAVRRRTQVRGKNIPKDNMRPVFVFADEAQSFIRETDTKWHESCRSYNGFGIYATQNIESFNATFGSGSRDAVKKLIGNIGVRVACRNNAEDTNMEFARLLGERKFKFSGSSVSVQRPRSAIVAGVATGKAGYINALNPSETEGSSTSDQVRALMQSADFGRLRTGGDDNKCIVEAIVYFEGKGPDTKTPFYRVTFNQETEEVKTIDSLANLLIEPVPGAAEDAANENLLRQPKHSTWVANE